MRRASLAQPLGLGANLLVSVRETQDALGVVETATRVDDLAPAAYSKHSA